MEYDTGSFTSSPFLGSIPAYPTAPSPLSLMTSSPNVAEAPSKATISSGTCKTQNCGKAANFGFLSDFAFHASWCADHAPSCAVNRTIVNGIACKSQSTGGLCRGFPTFGFMTVNGALYISMCCEHAVAGMVSAHRRCQHPYCQEAATCGVLDAHGRLVLNACSRHKQIGHRIARLKCSVPSLSLIHI